MQNIPFLSLDSQISLVESEIREAFERVLSSQWYILGKELQRFEQQYAAFNQVGHCIGVGNGLDALHIALKTLDIGPGDEVIVPSNTFIATWLAVTYSGASIVPVEPRLSTYNIDPDRIEAAITEKTRAIMPVHLYGQACEMTAIMRIAEKHGLAVIEDNAQAQGCTYNQKVTGSFGIINATSFYPTKNLGAFGDAGALTTNDETLAQLAMVLRNYGSEKKYHNERIGYNSRLDELQAAFLAVKLKYMQVWTSERQAIGAFYDHKLAGIQGLTLPEIAENAGHVYHLYVVRTSKRDELQNYLEQKGIGTGVHYPVPPHLQKAYRQLGYQAGDFPIAEQLAQTCLSLPLNPGMTTAALDLITDSIQEFYA